MYIKRFDHVDMFTNGTWATMLQWCKDNLYHGGHYEPNWHAQYPSFYFRDEKEYLLFCLKWS